MVYFLFHALYLAIKNTVMLSESQDTEGVGFMSQLTSYLLLYVQEIVKSGNIRVIFTIYIYSKGNKIFCNLKYYLKHEHECFIRYKTRGAAERFISDKARIASVLNSLKNDPFYTHLVTLFTKEF